jgi:hypothetical protein
MELSRLRAVAVLLAFAGPGALAREIPGRPVAHGHARGNVFTSEALPKLTVTLARGFRYLGSFPFDIRGVAGGFRYLFGEVDRGKHLHRLFVVQAEGFYPGKGAYDYPTRRPVVLAGDAYQHDVWIYDNDQSARKEPGNESDLTRKFIADRGYVWEPESIMSRYARTVDDSRQDEIIFFYFENLKEHTARRAADFSETVIDAEQKRILDEVDASSRRALRVSR